jgi:hypothetical protein
VIIEYEVSSEIQFLTNGRTYESTGLREGEFIVAFGELQSGPRFQTGLVVPFDARLVRPDGQVGYARAHLDYPADPALVHETDIMVLLYGLSPADVPLDTLIASIGQAK